MQDLRKHPRTAVDHPGWLSFNGINISCVVRNISPEGAAIDIDDAAYLPPRFRLVTAPEQPARNCRVVWIKSNRVGVAFED